MGKGPLELEGCPCIFAQGPPSSKLRHWSCHHTTRRVNVIYEMREFNCFIIMFITPKFELFSRYLKSLTLLWEMPTQNYDKRQTKLLHSRFQQDNIGLIIACNLQQFWLWDKERATDRARIDHTSRPPWSWHSSTQDTISRNYPPCYQNLACRYSVYWLRSPIKWL